VAGRRPRCAGLAVLHQGWAGLFDVATRPDARRQGLARALCEQLLHWAATQGAHHAYLQVVRPMPRPGRSMPGWAS
jgi:GNAT superfamily N-acetyltransferase